MLSIKYVVDLDREVEKATKRLHKRGGRVSKYDRARVASLRATRGFIRRGRRTAVIFLGNIWKWAKKDTTGLCSDEELAQVVMRTIYEEALHYAFDWGYPNGTNAEHHRGMLMLCSYYPKTPEKNKEA